MKQAIASMRFMVELKEDTDRVIEDDVIREEFQKIVDGDVANMIFATIRIITKMIEAGDLNRPDRKVKSRIVVARS